MRALLLVGLAATVALSSTPAGPSSLGAGSPPDTLDGIHEAIRLIRDRYTGASRSASARGNRGAGTQDRICDAGEGFLCHGGDPDRGECNANVSCHPTEEFFVEGLLEQAREYPTSGFLMGQAVYALTKFGHIAVADDLVKTCQAQEWWCEALRGYVLYFFAPIQVAEDRFRSALSEAPEDIRCRWEDALWLLGKWDQRAGGRESLPEGREETASWDCATRLAASDTLWWWADPLFSTEGNDRWATHIARAVGLQLYEELRRSVRGSDYPQDVRDHDWAMRIRRGPWDSYERLAGWSYARIWTSEEAARYHFIPDVEPGDLSPPRWRLEGDIHDEGYTPDYGPLFEIPVQIARFRAGDSLRVVAAGELEGSRLGRAVKADSHLVLTDAPGSLPLHVRRETRRETPVLLGDVAPRTYVASFEVITDLGVGINRQSVTPLEVSGPGLSDLLVYAPPQGLEADSLLAVTPYMLGSPRVEEGVEMGVFWELYEAPEGETLTFDLTLERESGGLVDRLVGLFPGGSQEGRGRVRWIEPVRGATHARGITLNLSDLRSGAYILSLTVRWPGQPPLERQRAFTVE